MNDNDLNLFCISSIVLTLADVVAAVSGTEGLVSVSWTAAENHFRVFRRNTEDGWVVNVISTVSVNPLQLFLHQFIMLKINVTYWKHEYLLIIIYFWICLAFCGTKCVLWIAFMGSFLGFVWKNKWSVFNIFVSQKETNRLSKRWKVNYFFKASIVHFNKVF